jgi:hypothetical protein
MYCDPIHIVVFWVVTPCILVGNTSGLEEDTSSILSNVSELSWDSGGWCRTGVREWVTKDGNYQSYMDMERSGSIGPEKENYSSGLREGISRCTCTSEERRYYVPITFCLTRTRLHGVITQRPQYESLAWKTSCFVYYAPGFLFLMITYDNIKVISCKKEI